MVQTMETTLDELLDQREWIGGLARSVVSDPALADDLVQDTWLSALRRRGPATDGALRAPRAWLATVLRNRAREQHRGEARRRGREQRRAVPEAATDTAQVAENFETQRTVAAAVASLAEPFRGTVLLHYYEGLSLAEIARRESIPAGTVRWRLHRAHALLREKFAQTFGTDHWRAALVPLFPTAVRRGAGAGALAAVATLAVVATGGWLAVSAWGGEPQRAAAPARAGAVSPQVDGGVDPIDRGAERVALPAAETGLADPDERAQRAPAESMTPQRAVVTARFHDASGAPLAGVSLQLVALHAGATRLSLDGAMRALFPAARSGPDGGVALELRAPSELLAELPGDLRRSSGEAWLLDFEASSPTALTRALQARLADGESVDLGVVALAQSATLTGRVVDAGGAGLAGVEVVVEEPPFLANYAATAARGEAPHGDRKTETSRWLSKGEFRLADVPCGLVTVWARKPGYRSAYRVVEVGDPDVTLEPLVLTESRDLEAEVARPGRLTVRVTQPDGVPAALAMVHYRNGHRSGSRRADAHGVAILDLGPRRSASVDLAALDAQGRWGPAQRLGWSANENETTLELTAGRSIDVTAWDEDGQRIAAFRAQWEAVEGGLGSGRAVAVAPGVARLVRPDWPFVLRVRAEGFATYEVGPFAVGEAPDAVEAQLARAAAIRGRVTQAGVPVRGAEVAILAPVDANTLLHSQGFRADFWTRGSAETGADGSFALHREEVGRVRLLVRHDGFAPALSGWIDVVPGRDCEAGTIEIGVGGVVEGQVSDATGRPVPRAIVGLNGYLGHARTVVADRLGRFRFERVRPGLHEVRVADAEVDSGWSYSTQTLDDMPERWSNVEVVEGAATRVDLACDGLRLRVRLAAAGTDWRGWRARLLARHDRRTVSAVVPIAADGSFVLGASTPGPYLVRMQSPGGVLGALLLEVDVQVERADQELSLGLAFGQLEASVAEVAGGGSCRLEWTDGRLRGLAPVFPGPETGAFRAPLVPVGTVRLTDGAADGRVERGVFTVR